LYDYRLLQSAAVGAVPTERYPSARTEYLTVAGRQPCLAHHVAGPFYPNPMQERLARQVAAKSTVLHVLLSEVPNIP
jgi:hypothetical protein